MPAKRDWRHRNTTKGSVETLHETDLMAYHFDPECPMHGQVLPLVASRTTGGRNNEFFPVTSKDHVIFYENSGFKRWNYCQHSRRDVNFAEEGPITLVKKDPVNSGIPFHNYDGCFVVGEMRKTIKLEQAGVIADVYFTREVDSLLMDWLWARGSENFFTKIQELDAMAIAGMTPKLDDGFSLPVFIYELADVKSMLRGVFNILRNLPGAVRALFHRPLNSLSDSWLSSVFGWIPFVSDCKTIFWKLATVQDEVNRFVNRANQRMTMHWQKGLSPFTFADPDWFVKGPIDFMAAYQTFPLANRNEDFQEIHWSAYKANVVRTPKYRATMEYKYRLPQFDKATLKLLAGLDYFGVNFSLSDVWAVIPFSFVLDWFTNVDTWLRSFDKENVPVELVIYKFCRSISYTQHSSVFKPVFTKILVHYGGAHDPDAEVRNETGDWTASPLTSFPSVMGRNYLRLVGIPHPEDTQWEGFSTPKGKKIISLAALMQQQLRPR